MVPAVRPVDSRCTASTASLLGPSATQKIRPCSSSNQYVWYCTPCLCWTATSCRWASATSSGEAPGTWWRSMYIGTGSRYTLVAGRSMSESRLRRRPPDRRHLSPGRQRAIPVAEGQRCCGAEIGTMNAERCGECGFDSDDWSDATAIEAIQRLPRQWRSAVAGLTPNDLQRRPIDQMWSIAEYVDHVREVLFGMRFLLDTAISQPGTDLGESPTQPFASQPRRIDVEAALDGIDHEAHSLSAQLSGLSSHDWLLTVRFDSAAVDPHWIARHAVHDASHHLLDGDRLRSAL